MYVRMCVDIYIYIYIHTYVYIYIYRERDIVHDVILLIFLVLGGTTCLTPLV